MLRVTTIVKMC